MVPLVVLLVVCCTVPLVVFPIVASAVVPVLFLEASTVVFALFIEVVTPSSSPQPGGTPLSARSTDAHTDTTMREQKYAVPKATFFISSRSVEALRSYSVLSLRIALELLEKSSVLDEAGFTRSFKRHVCNKPVSDVSLLVT